MPAVFYAQREDSCLHALFFYTARECCFTLADMTNVMLHISVCGISIKGLFCRFGKNSRIINGVCQHIGHYGGIAASHRFIFFQNVRGYADRYGLLFFRLFRSAANCANSFNASGLDRGASSV